MFGRRITLFKLFGFEVRLDASWILIAVLVTWSLAAAMFPAEYPGLTPQAYWLMGIVGALGFFGSIVIHELCHSLVANHHKLPMRGITLFIFGGVAEMGGEPQSPKVEFLMAIAGPIASIVLGLVFYLAAAATRGGRPEVVGVFAYLAWINLILAGFNLIPAFPLDGGRVLRAALWSWKGNLTRATAIASRIGAGFGFLLMAYAIYQLFYGYVISAIWSFLIGAFLRGASQMSYEQVVVRQVLGGEPVSRFMRPHPVTVGPEISIRELVEEYFYRYDFKVYPVVGESEDLIGCVTTADVKAIPKEEWDRHRVSEIAKPCSEANIIGPETDAMQVLSRIRGTAASGLLVAERNHLVGMISARDILNYLAAKMELEGRGGGLPAAPRL